MQLLRHLEMQRAFDGLEIDIHSMQIPLLNYIMEHEGCTQVNIADALRVSSASVALSTKRMAQSGLLDKSIDEKNLRCRRIFITDKGREIAGSGVKICNMLDENMMHGISENEVKVFCDILDKMITNMSEDGVSTLSNFELRERVSAKKKEEK
ncbi:MAG: MarR family transcriptional regulator [Clostridia bacterium]